MTPKVSVVMSVYNAGDFLQEAVDSVLAQRFADFELIMIDDGSTDGSLSTLRRISDARVKIIQQENRGLIASLNRGIALSTGQYIARMDADDRCMPDRFGLQANHLDQHPDIALLGSGIATMDENGSPLAPCVRFPQTHAEIWAGMGRRPWVFCHPAVMFRRAAAVEMGMYRSDFAHAEDAEFFARLMTRYQAANLPDVLLSYRLRRSAISFTKSAHGRINAELVAKMIQDWKPGAPFQASAEQRALADAAIAACEGVASGTQMESAYQCRVGRELLRGREWQRARRHYANAAKTDWRNRMAYLGMICSLLHYGAEPSEAGKVRANISDRDFDIKCPH
jgi:glycosyltransferase involved in cell wall biosynthesis